MIVTMCQRLEDFHARVSDAWPGYRLLQQYIFLPEKVVCFV